MTEGFFDTVPKNKIQKKNIPDFLTLARKQRKRGCDAFSQHISDQASVNT